MRVLTLAYVGVLCLLHAREFGTLDERRDHISMTRISKLQALNGVLLVFGRHHASSLVRDFYRRRFHFLPKTNTELRVAALSMIGDSGVVAPIGPFSPFRSSHASDSSALGQNMNQSMMEIAEMQTEMERFGLEMQMGNSPKPAQCLSLADKILKALEISETAITRMRFSDDFQSQEFFHLTEAVQRLRNESLDSASTVMRWQAECMKAFGTGLPPPPPPPNIDLAKLYAQGEQGSPASMPRPREMVMDEMPFGVDALQSEMVKEEFQALCKDHAQLISMGEQYGSFDPLGKIAFIDALEAIENRWDVFITRFELMGAINPKFVRKANDYLKSMELTPAIFREILSEAHQLMRKAAEKERTIQ